MILSASRRTDLPCAHAEWLCARFRAGEALVRNPMNPRRVSRVSLRREDVDGIVFWSKNPRPLMARLDAFDGYAYYFQFTLNGYGPEIEPNLPGVAERLATFRALAEKIGPERVLWRYDPILLSRVHPGRRLAHHSIRSCPSRSDAHFRSVTQSPSLSASHSSGDASFRRFSRSRSSDGLKLA